MYDFRGILARGGGVHAHPTHLGINRLRKALPGAHPAVGLGTNRGPIPGGRAVACVDSTMKYIRN